MLQLERRPVTAPISYRRCLVHGQLVGLDGEGRLLGLCWSCAQEAANAKAKIERRNIG